MVHNSKSLKPTLKVTLSFSCVIGNLMSWVHAIRWERERISCAVSVKMRNLRNGLFANWVTGFVGQVVLDQFFILFFLCDKQMLAFPETVFSRKVKSVKQECAGDFMLLVTLSEAFIWAQHWSGTCLSSWRSDCNQLMTSAQQQELDAGTSFKVPQLCSVACYLKFSDSENSSDGRS